MENETNFRAGFIRGMKTRGENRTGIVQNDHTVSYYDGYTAALLHWAGLTDARERRAYNLGLIEEYSGYHGQSGWVHPKP